jgi:hypothetical protein
MRDCAKRIAEKSGLSYEDAKKIVKSADTEARRRANDGFNYDDAVADIIKERLANVEANVKKQKANAARNVIIKKKTETQLQQFIDAGLSVSDSVRAMLEGIERPIEGAKASVDAQKNAAKSIYLSEFVGKLTKENLMDIFADGKLSDEIGENLFKLSNKQPADFGSPQAKRIAEIIHEVREGQRLRMNKAGADIGEVSGYVMPQRHDLVEMRAAGQDKWVSEMMDLVDTKRTFGGDYDDLDTALRSAYDAMISGVRLTTPIVQNEKLFQFSGPANLAKKLSRSREIHFKDYASWKKWNETYGMRSLHEGVIEAVSYDAENIALLERFGTNPEAMIKAAVDNTIKANRGKVQAKGGEQEFIKRMVNVMMENHKIPASATMARIGSLVRLYQQTTKLGGALLSSITDIPIKSLTYMYNGQNFLSATSKSFMDTAYGFRSKKERVEFASMLGVYMESITGDVGARFNQFDDFAGKAAKVQRLFFRLNGLTWWTDTHKAAFARTMAHSLGMKADLPFDKLSADMQRIMGNYRIDAKDWDKMRAGVMTLEDGRAYVLAENIKDKKVAEKLVMYILDQQQSAVITPGAREQRIATWGGLQRGTPAGEAVRLIMQFKNFPITIGTKVIGRAWYGKGKPDVGAMVYLALMTGTFGYLAGAMKDLTKGKTPKDIRKPQTIAQAFAQGGGFGLVGDLLFTEPGFGKDPIVAMMGPTASTLGDIIDIPKAALWGKGSARMAAMFAVNSIPFNNLFYLRAALDQMFLLQMQEELNPGYLRRTENQMEKTYGQERLF